MGELYLINVVGKIADLSDFVFCLCVIITICAWIVGAFALGDGVFTGEFEKDDIQYKICKYSKIISVKTLIIGTIAALITVFVPNKKDMYMIFGVGTAIDYIQKNEDVKKLPDKCVNAIEMWVDSINKETEE